MLMIGALIPIKARFTAGQHCGSKLTSNHRPNSSQLFQRVSLRGLLGADNERAHRAASK
jgi:hypothetical protein